MIINMLLKLMLSGNYYGCLTHFKRHNKARRTTMRYYYMRIFNIFYHFIIP